LNLEPTSSFLAKGRAIYSLDFLIEQENELTQAAIAKKDFTHEQRNLVLLDFLKKVAATETDIKFNIHQELWFEKASSTLTENFISEMSRFINLCIFSGVDDLIKGIRLGENNQFNQEEILKFALRVSAEINKRTGNWLQKKEFWMGGGGSGGAFFKGIATSSQSEEFFKKMSEEVGAFAFTYKHHQQIILNGMDCQMGCLMEKLDFDRNNYEDVRAFIEEELGFRELINFIKASRDDFPLHANVVFIGDGNDALEQMTDVHEKAVQDLLKEAGDGFQGNLGMNVISKLDLPEVSVYDLESKLRFETQQKWINWPE
jgi:hypothetical protein